jgi:hypothetical protein
MKKLFFPLLLICSSFILVSCQGLIISKPLNHNPWLEVTEILKLKLSCDNRQKEECIHEQGKF